MAANIAESATAPVRRKPSKAQIAARCFAGFVVFVVFMLWYMGVIGGNVRTVEAGRVYRSAQITGGLLDRTLQEYHIRTSLNLRGGSPADAWYRAEIEACARRGVKHIDVPFSAVRYPPPTALKGILKTFDTAEYPVLLHCRGGADRSGLTSVLYLHLYKNVPLDEALSQQLTWRYGHIRWGQAHAMDDFFALYRKTGANLGLRAWIETQYPALYESLPEKMKVQEDKKSGSPAKGAPDISWREQETLNAYTA